MRAPLSIHTRLTLWYSAVLLATLVVISALSYSLLSRSLAQDVDHSLLTVAEVVRDNHASADFSPERVLREVLGADLLDQFFQIVDPEGAPSVRAQLPGRPRLPLSGAARTNAARGRPTFETLRFERGHDVRIVTLPLGRAGAPGEVVQVGMSLAQSQRTLHRYLQSLLILVPLGVLLAATGGALMARAALRPVDQMSSAARRITAEALGERVSVRGTGDELDRLAGTLNGMLGRLETAFAEIRRFSADAAHELRTPLTVLKGGLEVALRAKRSPEEYRRVLEGSLEEVERLIRLAEDLLMLSRASSVPETRREPVDLEPLALDVLDVGARLAAGTGVAVRLKEAAPVTVRGNPAALRRAALNLMDNAVKYTPAGGAVELSVARDGGEAVLTVEDTGPGIAPEDAARVFEPFVRLDAARARDTGGSGLGLAITRSIVQAHGGRIAVERGAAGGARLTIRLPAEPADTVL